MDISVFDEVLGRALDGDTYRRDDGSRARLQDVNAAEVPHRRDDPPALPVADKATAYTQEFLARPGVHDRVVGQDRHRRDLVQVFDGEGNDLQRELVQEGLAAPGPYATRDYLADMLLGDVKTGGGLFDTILGPGFTTPGGEMPFAEATLAYGERRRGHQRSEFGRGVAAGVDDIQAMGHGLRAWFNGVMGDKADQMAALSDYEREIRSAADRGISVERIEDIDDVGDLFDWMASSLGRAAPSLVGAVGTGGTGAVVGGATKVGLKQYLRKRMGDQVARELGIDASDMLDNPIVQNAIKSRMKAGAYLGAGSFTSGIETGGTYAQLLQDGIDAPLTSLIAGTASGALDVFAQGQAIKRILGPGTSDATVDGVREILRVRGKEMLREGLKQSLVEGSTEAAQELIQAAAIAYENPDVDFFTADTASQAANAFAVGALVGAVTTGGGKALKTTGELYRGMRSTSAGGQDTQPPSTPQERSAEEWFNAIDAAQSQVDFDTSEPGPLTAGQTTVHPLREARPIAESQAAQAEATRYQAPPQWDGPVEEDEDAGPFGSMVPDFSGMAQPTERATAAPAEPYQPSLIPMTVQEDRASRRQAPAVEENVNPPQFDDSRQQQLGLGAPTANVPKPSPNPVKDRILEEDATTMPNVDLAAATLAAKVGAQRPLSQSEKTLARKLFAPLLPELGGKNVKVEDVLRAGIDRVGGDGELFTAWKKSTGPQVPYSPAASKTQSDAQRVLNESTPDMSGRRGQTPAEIEAELKPLKTRERIALQAEKIADRAERPEDLTFDRGLTATTEPTFGSPDGDQDYDGTDLEAAEAEFDALDKANAVSIEDETRAQVAAVSASIRLGGLRAREINMKPQDQTPEARQSRRSYFPLRTQKGGEARYTWQDLEKLGQKLAQLSGDVQLENNGTPAQKTLSRLMRAASALEDPALVDTPFVGVLEQVLDTMRKIESGEIQVGSDADPVLGKRGDLVSLASALQNAHRSRKGGSATPAVDGTPEQQAAWVEEAVEAGDLEVTPLADRGYEVTPADTDTGRSAMAMAEENGIVVNGMLSPRVENAYTDQTTVMGDTNTDHVDEDQRVLDQIQAESEVDMESGKKRAPYSASGRGRVKAKDRVELGKKLAEQEDARDAARKERAKWRESAKEALTKALRNDDDVKMVKVKFDVIPRFGQFRESEVRVRLTKGGQLSVSFPPFYTGADPQILETAVREALAIEDAKPQKQAKAKAESDSVRKAWVAWRKLYGEGAGTLAEFEKSQHVPDDVRARYIAMRRAGTVGKTTLLQYSARQGYPKPKPQTKAEFQQVVEARAANEATASATPRVDAAPKKGNTIGEKAKVAPAVAKAMKNRPTLSVDDADAMWDLLRRNDLQGVKALLAKAWEGTASAPIVKAILNAVPADANLYTLASEGRKYGKLQQQAYFKISRRKSDGVSLREAFFNEPSMQRLHTEHQAIIVLHELSHLATASKLSQNAAAQKTLSRVLKRVNELKALQVLDADDEAWMNNTNMLLDEYELIAWATTSPRAQAILSKLPSAVDGKSLFDKVVDVIAQLFGLGSGRRTLLHDTLSTLADILEGPTPDAFEMSGDFAMSDVVDQGKRLVPAPLKRLASAIKPAVEKVMRSAGTYMATREGATQALKNIAAKFAPGGGFYEKSRGYQATLQKMAVDAFSNWSKDRQHQAALDAQLGRNTADAKVVRKFFDDAVNYLREIAGDDRVIDYVENYLPRLYNLDAINNDFEGFVGVLMKARAKQMVEGRAVMASAFRTREEARRFAETIRNRTGEELAVFSESSGSATWNQHSMARFFAESPEGLENYLNMDLMHLAASYSRNFGRMAAEAELFGGPKVLSNGDTVYIRNLQFRDAVDASVANGMSQQDAEYIRGPVYDALMGRLGADVNPEARKWIQRTMMYQNFRTLLFAPLSSFVDFTGIMARSGDFRESMAAFMDAANSMTREELVDLAKMLGLVGDTVTQDIMRQMYADGMASDKVSETGNNFFFKWTGMQALTDTTRVVAVAAGKRMLVKWASTASDPVSRSHLERLTPDGMSPESLAQLILEWERQGAHFNGNLITMPQSQRVVAEALQRFVNQSIMNPNPGQRPTWSSHPVAALIFHLKQFMWSFHETVFMPALKHTRLLAQHHGPMEAGLYALGNFGVLMGLAAMGLVVRNFLQYQLWGDEPPESRDPAMSTEFLMELFDRSGGAGIAQLMVDGAKAEDRGQYSLLSPFGPTVGQLQDFLTADETVDEGEDAQWGKGKSNELIKAIPVLSQIYPLRRGFVDWLED